MRELTLIMAYYENHTMLQKQLHQIRSYDRKVLKNLKLIIVDDGSPKTPARFDSDPACEASIYRMLVDVRWNQDACRNLGVHHAKTDWIMMTDMDHLIPAETIYEIMTCTLNPDCACRFARVSAPAMEPYKPHPNSWLMTKKLYDSFGGYDERLAGWYGTDGDFLDRVQIAAPILRLDCPLIRVPREVIPDASTTQFTRKSKEDFEAIQNLRRKNVGTKPLSLSFPWEKVL